MAIALGSNSGDRLANLRRGLCGLDRLLDGLRVGPLFRSAPEGGAAQTDYLNTAAIGAWHLGPEELLAALKSLELSGGRRRGPRNAPRPLDLDLLIFGDQVVRRPELTIPHPRLSRRSFVLAPLAELAPDWRMPPSGAPVAELLRALDAEATLEEVSWPQGWVEGQRLVTTDC